MASINQATLIGFVGDEPRIATANNGSTIASISVATTDKGFTKQDGTVVEDKTEWHNVVAFGRLADVIKNYIHKGACVYVQGKMRTRAYEDKNNVKRYIMEIVADTFQMLDRRPDNTSTTVQCSSGQVSYQPLPEQDEDLPF